MRASTPPKMGKRDRFMQLFRHKSEDSHRHNGNESQSSLLSEPYTSSIKSDASPQQNSKASILDTVSSVSPSEEHHPSVNTTLPLSGSTLTNKNAYAPGINDPRQAPSGTTTTSPLVSPNEPALTPSAPHDTPSPPEQQAVGFIAPKNFALHNLLDELKRALDEFSPFSDNFSDGQPGAEKKRETFFVKHPDVVDLIKGGLRLGSIVAGASPLPFLPVIFDALIEFESFLEEISEHDNTCEQLANNAVVSAAHLVRILESSPQNTALPSSDLFADLLRGPIMALINTLKIMSKTMRITRTDGLKGDFQKVWKRREIGDNIRECLDAGKPAQDQFVMLASAFTATNVMEILSATRKLLLAQSKWNISHLAPRTYIEAGYNEVQDISVCLPDTRTAVISRIMSRLRDGTANPSASTASTLTVLATSNAPPKGSLSTHIVLIQALAGSGKSTTTKSVALQLEQERRLAGSFFFSGKEEVRSGSKDVVATLANQFAIRNDAFADALTRVVQAPNYIPPADMTQQLNDLLITPLNAIASSLSSNCPLIFVLDGLDECGGDQGKSFLEILLSKIELFPSQIYFLLTSRPVSVLVSQLTMVPDDNLVNMDKDEYVSTARQDIRIYFSTHLCNLLPNKWTAPPDTVESLVDASNGLFLFAAIARHLIEQAASQRRELEMVESILAHQWGNGNEAETETSPVGVLDKLYNTVLEQAFLVGDAAPMLRKQTSLCHQDIIGAIVHAREPISIDLLVQLTRRSLNEVLSALELLSSILLLPGSNDFETPIRIRHFSFTQYITNPKGEFLEKHPELLIDGRMNEILAKHAFEIMNQQLHFNISKSASSFLPNSALSQAHVEHSISHLLAYACRFWGAHLESLPPLSELALPLLTEFMEQNLLFWLEALGVLGAMNTAVPALSSLASRLKPIQHSAPLLPPIEEAAPPSPSYVQPLSLRAMKLALLKVKDFVHSLFHRLVLSILGERNATSAVQSSPVRQLGTVPPKDDPPTLEQLVDDAIKFARYFAPAIIRSAPHTYISTLPFAPISSPIRRLYEPHFRNMITVEKGRLQQWPAEQMVIRSASSVFSVVFMPGGKRIVGSSGLDIWIWDAATGEAVAGPFEGHDDWINSVAPSPDGKLIVSGSNDKTIRIWDAATGKTVVGPLEGHGDWVRSVAFSLDGERIVSGSDDHIIRVWDAVTGKCVAGPFEEHHGYVYSVTFSPDGERVASGSEDHTIRIWDVATGMTVVGPFEGHTETVRSVSFSPDGKRIASGSDDHTIRIWDTATGKTVTGPLEGHAGDINSVAFSPDGKWVVSGSGDHTIRIWDATTGNLVVRPLKGHSSSVLSVSFSPDGMRIASGSYDHTIRIWDAVTGDTGAGLREGHHAAVNSVSFSLDGKHVASCSSDKTIRIWDAMTGEMVADPFEGHGDRVLSVAFSSDSKCVASGSSDNTIRIWDIGTGGTVGGPFEGHTKAVSSVAFSPDGKRIASGSYDDTIRIWDTATGKTVVGPLEGHTEDINSVAFSPDGKWVVSGSDDETIQMWDAVTGEAVAWSFEGHDYWVMSVTFSPDGKRIASGSVDKTVRLWDAMTGEPVGPPLEGHDWVLSVAFSPSGKHVVAGSDDGTLRVWDVETGECVAGPLEGHKSSANSVAYSPDGKHVVSGSNDNTIRIVDIHKTLTSPDLSFSFSDQAFVDPDGWAHPKREDDQLLFWVPPAHRQSLHHPSTQKIMGVPDTQLDCSKVIWGEEWATCYVPANRPGATV